ncbi:MAG: cupin domain-containing protein [Chloroflexi bacterium]|nr:cupin domain-containing protein [Chloroflexota bacterium]
MSKVFDIETLPRAVTADGKSFKQIMVSPETLGSQEMEVSAITLKQGAEETFHRHEGSLNLLYGLMGKGQVVLAGGGVIEIEQETLVWIEAGGVHKLANPYAEDFVVLDLFTPAGAKTEVSDGSQAVHGAAKVFRMKDMPVVVEKTSGKRRIYLATKELVGTDQAEGMIVTYTPGTFTPEHFHDSAESFFIPLWGNGFIWTEDGKYAMHRGKMAFFRRGDRHALHNPNLEEFAFLEFHIPGYWDMTNTARPEDMKTSAPRTKPEPPRAQ